MIKRAYTTEKTSSGFCFSLLATIHANTAGKIGMIKKLRKANININPIDANRTRLNEKLFVFNPK